MKKNNKSLTINSVFYLIYNLLNVIFPFITGMYVTHIILPDSIGLVEKARNFVQYFVILSFLGIPTYGLREIAKNRNNKEKINKIYSELMIINGISTIFFTSIYIILIFCIPYCAEELRLYLIVGISIILNLFNNSWLYEGLEEFKYISLRNILFKIISFVILILFVRTTDDYLIYGFISVIGTAGNYILNMINSKKYVKFTFKYLNLKQHLKSIFYLVVVNLAIEIYSLIDITMLGILCDNETVAFYSYGVKIYKIILQIVNTFTMVLVPRISLYYKEGKIKEFNELLTKTLKIIFIITVPMIVGINFTSNYLITQIYGDEYIRSSFVLNILSLIVLISPIGYLLGSRVLLVSNTEKKMIIPVACGAIINIIGNYILINRYKEIGAAIASLTSEFVVMAIYVFLGKKYFKLSSIKDTLFKICASILIMSIFLKSLSILNINMFYKTTFQIIGGIIIYFGCLTIFKEEFICNFINSKFLGVKKDEN